MDLYGPGYEGPMPTHQIGNVTFTTAGTYAPRMVLLMEELPPGVVAPYRKSMVLVREDVPAGTSLEAYRQAHVRQVAGAGFRAVQLSTIKVMDQDCPLLEAESASPTGVPLANLIAYLRVGDAVYTLNASAVRGEAFEKARAEFVAVMQSLRVE